MTNKPKFGILSNSRYAFEGMITVLKSEKSFKTQLAIIVVIGLVLPFVEVSFITKLILFVSTWLVLFAEAVNSSIERVVDLVTLEHHELAKQAKDIGAFFVSISLLIVIAIWGITLYAEFVEYVK